jgi:hypothetical protein
MTIQITQNLDDLLARAPEAINSYNPGHWDLMVTCEKRAKQVVDSCDVDEAITFLADVAYLKQPHKIDRANLQAILIGHKDTIKNCLHNLKDIDRLDYSALEHIAKIPFFGRGGGRSFASALLRLFRPDKYGIIDWRNLAVLVGAKGFDGLVIPPFSFSAVTPRQVISEKGHMLFTQDLYIDYNNALRQLAAKYRKWPAEIDLVLWVYSIDRLPFPAIRSGQALFVTSFLQRLQRPGDSARRKNLNSMVEEYINRLNEVGNLSPHLVRGELVAIFQFVLDEFMSFAYRLRTIRHNKIVINNIKATLEAAISSKDSERLLAKWKDWENKVNPASPSYTGHTNLPADMVMNGYVIFEDLAAIRKYFEDRYCDVSFLSKDECL